MNVLGNRIKEIRQRLGLTQEALAKKVGVTKAAVSKWEKGMELSLNNGAAVARALSITVDELLYGELNDETECFKNRIPIVGTTQAGPDKEWFDLGYPAGWGDEYVDFPSNSPNVYALKVSGNSMSPRILEGEAVIVNPNGEVTTGEEVIVRLDSGSVMVKILSSIQNGKVVLDSYNNGFDRIVRPINEVIFMHPVIGVARMSNIKLAI